MEYLTSAHHDKSKEPAVGSSRYWPDYIIEAIHQRLLAFNGEGKFVCGNRQALESLNLTATTSLADSLPLQWFSLREIITAGVGRQMLLGEGPGAFWVDARPLTGLGQPEGILCWLIGQPDCNQPENFSFFNNDLKSILDQSYDGLWVCDGKANVLYINKAYEKRTGIDYRKLIGRNMNELVSEGYFDVSVTLEVLKRKTMVTMVQNTRDGRQVLSTGSPIFGKDGNIAMVICNDREIKLLDQMREKLLSSVAVTSLFQDELLDRKTSSLIRKDFIYRSQAMENLVEKALRVARSNSTVLITGSSGSGKEKVADLIHRWSARAENPMVRVNCGAIPESLFEAEFFGYTAGAFTGARREGKSGLVELAHNSTLFLDEVAEIPLASQVKLLRFLDDGKVFRVGGTTGRQLDVRIIAATNQDLATMVDKGRFRQDLYYRVRVVPIEIPPLTERREDIVPLLDHFVKYFANREGRQRRISVKAMDILSAYDYPGNVRELINICEQIVVMSPGPEIRPEDLPASTKAATFRDPMPGLALVDPSEDGMAQIGLKQMVEEYERLLLQKAIKKHPKRKDAARALGIDPATITRKLQKYCI